MHTKFAKSANMTLNLFFDNKSKSGTKERRTLFGFELFFNLYAQEQIMNQHKILRFLITLQTIFWDHISTFLIFNAYGQKCKFSSIAKSMNCFLQILYLLITI